MLFDGDERVSEPMPAELDVWKRALEAGLISDLPVAHEDSSQLLPPGFHVQQVNEVFDPTPGAGNFIWKSPEKNYRSAALRQRNDSC